MCPAGLLDVRGDGPGAADVSVVALLVNAEQPAKDCPVVDLLAQLVEGGHAGSG